MADWNALLGGVEPEPWQAPVNTLMGQVGPPPTPYVPHRTPSERGVSGWLQRWGVPGVVADTTGAVASLLPWGAAYDGGQLMGQGIEERNALLGGLGALAAAPLGIGRARIAFTPEMRDAARRLYDSYGLHETADRVGVSPGVLRRHFAAEGVPVRPAGGQAMTFTPEMQEAARRAYVDQGRNLRDVADLIGVDVRVLMRHFAANGVSTARRVPNAAEMRPLYEEGVSIREIARRLDLDRSTVRNHLRAAGVDTSGPVRAADTMGQVEAMRRDGLSYLQIATQLGLTRNQVAGMVRDLRARGQTVP